MGFSTELGWVRRTQPVCFFKKINFFFQIKFFFDVFIYFFGFKLSFLMFLYGILKIILKTKIILCQYIFK
jgi:hypothetical protein